MTIYNVRRDKLLLKKRNQYNWTRSYCIGVYAEKFCILEFVLQVCKKWWNTLFNRIEFENHIYININKVWLNIWHRVYKLYKLIRNHFNNIYIYLFPLKDYVIEVDCCGHCVKFYFFLNKIIKHKYIAILMLTIYRFVYIYIF